MVVFLYLVLFSWLTPKGKDKRFTNDTILGVQFICLVCRHRTERWYNLEIEQGSEQISVHSHICAATLCKLLSFAKLQVLHFKWNMICTLKN